MHGHEVTHFDKRPAAVVAGAGIGGLAVAGGLLRAGWRVTVLESTEAFAPVGAAITLSPNAVKAMDWLGLGDRLRGRAVAQGAAGLRTAGGRWLMRSRVEVLRERFGVPAFALHRADLHRLLLDSARGAELRTGHRVTGLRQDGGRVTASIATPSGSSELEARVLIGADGIHSVVREAVVPGHAGPAYAGYVTWRGVVDAAAVARIGVPESVAESWGRGERFGIVPLADGQVYWFATASGPLGTGSDDDLAAVTDRFAGWHPPIPQLLAATDPEKLLRHDIAYLRDPLPTYARGRVALLGDAAHAITPDLGQGGALALEDATVLVRALGDQPDDVPAALAAYDAARRTRTQKLVRVSAQVGRIAQWHDPAAAGLRNLLVGLVPAGAYLRSSEDTFSWTPPAPEPDPPTRSTDPTPSTNRREGISR